ncbi:MAG: sugar kinase [Desulfarculus sp.]|nr:sugar kinase [Desulfarculus sp.]
MLTVVGTVPQPDFPLLEGVVSAEAGGITIAGRHLEAKRGTPALLAAALATARALGGVEVRACLVGDVGLGDGSRKLYRHLTEVLPRRDCAVLTFHYLQPDVDWHNRVLFAVEEMPIRPLLVADAGFMYAAKMSGQAGAYDLFTPDAGELAFLADERAPHPFYTRGFILQDEDGAPELIARAYLHENAARHLLVKGRVDYMADQGGVWASVSEPSHPALEAIGGTGDTLTGMVSALLAAGLEMRPACRLAARANRLAGDLAQPDPATQVAAIIAHIPQALAALGQGHGMAKAGS